MQVIVVDLDTKETSQTMYFDDYEAMASKNWTPSPDLNSKTVRNSSKLSKHPQLEVWKWTKNLRKPSLSSLRLTPD